jgi:hypothetical protein
LKIIYPQIVKMAPDILEFMPELEGKNEDRYPERDFFYRVLNAMHPDIVEELIK